MKHETRNLKILDLGITGRGSEYATATCLWIDS